VKILLLSAYDAASHQRWRKGLEAQFPDSHWTQLSLPPRYFNWRIRGNSLSWGFAEQAALNGDYDLLIATSMVDLSALRGFVPALGTVPTLVYFHENQFAYPMSSRQHKGIEPQMVNLYSALCGDLLVFNSDFNRQSFFEGTAALLKKLPDRVPAGLIERMRDRSRVIPVPLEEGCFVTGGRALQGQCSPGERLQLLWNHRWEYDKGPDRLLRALERLLPRDLPLTVHVVGQQFRQSPPEFEDIRTLLVNYGALGQWGYVSSRNAYRQLLESCHLVLSTALHDFQGLAVLEAVAAGCRPLVPERQAYPEWFGRSCCYTSDETFSDREAEALAEAIIQQVEIWSSGQNLAVPDVTTMVWPRLRPHYQAAFEVAISEKSA